MLEHNHEYFKSLHKVPLCHETQQIDMTIKVQNHNFKTPSNIENIKIVVSHRSWPSTYCSMDPSDFGDIFYN